MSNIDLSTEYLGLRLASPLIPEASLPGHSLDNALRLEDAGAAAILMHSLFEEELRHDEKMATRFLIHPETGHAEADSFLPFSAGYRHGLDRYLARIRALKDRLAIPVIASLSGVSPDGWLDHARELEQAGANALELDTCLLAADTRQNSQEVEERYVELVQGLRSRAGIPLTVRLAPWFTALPHFVRQLGRAGAGGVVLFSRMPQPDIDLENLRVSSRLPPAGAADSLRALRWIAILYGRVDVSLAAAGGIHTTGDVLKALLAGADAACLGGTAPDDGPRRLADIRTRITAWMEEHGFESITELKGWLSQRHCADPAAYEHSGHLWFLDGQGSPPGVQR